LPVELLFEKINDLSSNVEQLLESENEEECESLLVQRQSLLEQLAEEVAELTGTNPSSELSYQYREFLISIQKRDALSVKFALKQSQEISSKLSKQVKSKKAIKAYQKLL
jgi:hypothetical protein